MASSHMGSRSTVCVANSFAVCTFPPSLSAEYAHRHDDGMWQAMEALLGGLTGTEEQKSTAWQLTTLPMRMGGLGLRCAGRMAPAACWSSWADALPMIHERLPQAAQNVVDGLEGAQEVGGCIGELRAVSLGLDRQGFVGRPTWTQLKLGAGPPPADVSEPGEWAHGWQYFASSVSEHRIRKTTVLRQSCPSHPTLEEDVLMCCMAARRAQPPWTAEVATGLLAHIQADCAHVQWLPRGCWQGSAEKREPQCVKMSC